MVKILIVRWIIINCDKEKFLGMRWHNRDKGIFWLYWKHQSSKSCRENTTESSAYYEYYRAWAKHKNNHRIRQPRDLKAAFRNALEKKDELERLTEMDTKERIYWRITNFPNDQNESCAPAPPKAKKPKRQSSKGRKASKNLTESNADFPVNFRASTSTADEDVILEAKKSRAPSSKGDKKNCEKDRSVLYEPAVNGFSESLEVTNNQPSLPPFIIFKGNENDNCSWDDSLKDPNSNFSSQQPNFLEPSYEKRNEEDLWTPPFFPQTPPELSSDLMEISPTEMRDLLIQNQRINYSFHPTPPQETTDIILENITDADLMTLGHLVNQEESTILKYSFPFQPKVVPTSMSQVTKGHQATSLHCSPLDFVSQTKTLNIQSNNHVQESRTTPENAFLFDQKQCSYDQVVPPFSEAFQTSQQLIDTSELFVNDSMLYSPPPVKNPQQILEELCHQQIDTTQNSVEVFRYNNQTSHDSGISDMDFFDYADKLLDDIDSKCAEQSYQMS